MDLSNLKLPDLSKLISPPPPINIPDTKTARIVSAIDNIKNINRVRDMDNLSYQIKLKEQQKRICEKRLNGINSTIDIRVGRIISILIIIFSVIIPFLIVSICEWLKPFLVANYSEWIKLFKNCIFIYLVVSFIISMLTMSIYLFHFWKR